jgi:hypothetical protein
MSTKEIMNEMLSLPVEQRALLADSLLKSLNAPETEIDKEWFALAELRLEEIRSGKIKPVNGEEVFRKIWKKFSE